MAHSSWPTSSAKTNRRSVLGHIEGDVMGDPIPIVSLSFGKCPVEPLQGCLFDLVGRGLIRPWRIHRWWVAIRRIKVIKVTSADSEAIPTPMLARSADESDACFCAATRF